MFIFKHPKDLRQLPWGRPARLRLEGIWHHSIQSQSGYAVLIEATDIYLEEILPELPCPLADVPWEGVTLELGFFHGIVLTNNSFGIDFLIPDADWLPETLRASLEQHLSRN